MLEEIDVLFPYCMARIQMSFMTPLDGIKPACNYSIEKRLVSIKQC